MVPLKSSEEIRWNERFGNRKHEETKAAADEPAKDTETEDSGRSSMKNMIEIKEMHSLDETGAYTAESPVKEATKEQTMRLQYLFQKLIKEAVASNNEEMAEHLVQRISESVKGDLCKELDYQFRLMEERDEERITGRYEQEDKRNEEYYKRIDELLRQYSGKSVKMKEKNKERLTVIRMLKASLDKERIDKKIEITDEVFLKVLEREVKLRKDSKEEFLKASREDLVANIQKELDILGEYLPEQLTKEEVEKIIDDAIHEISATTMRDMKKVMEIVNPKVVAKFDMKEVSSMIKDKLS